MAREMTIKKELWRVEKALKKKYGLAEGTELFNKILEGIRTPPKGEKLK